MSLSEKMTALCRTLGIARDVPVRVALDMMEKNMGLESDGLWRPLCGGRVRRARAAAHGVARVTAPFLGSPSSARITFLARAQGLMG